VVQLLILPQYCTTVPLCPSLQWCHASKGAQLRLKAESINPGKPQLQFIITYVFATEVLLHVQHATRNMQHAACYLLFSEVLASEDSHKINVNNLWDLLDTLYGNSNKLKYNKYTVCSNYWKTTRYPNLSSDTVSGCKLRTVDGVTTALHFEISFCWIPRVNIALGVYYLSFYLEVFK